MAATDAGGFALASHKNKCIQNNLRFVRDADVVLNEADSPRWVVRLTETKKRADGQCVKWRDAGGPSGSRRSRTTERGRSGRVGLNAVCGVPFVDELANRESESLV